MATAFVIDKYYLTITFLITLAWQCLGFFIAWTFQVCSLRQSLCPEVTDKLGVVGSLIRLQSEYPLETPYQ